MSETWIIREHPEGAPLYITTESARFGEEIAVIYSGNMEHAHLIKAAPKMHDALERLCSDDLREQLLDAQQDINFHANMTMAQALANASLLIDRIDNFMLAGRQALAEAKGETE